MRRVAKASSRSAAAVPQTLAGLLEQRVEDLRGFLRRALRTWDVDAIHQARVTTRRLKAAVDLLRPLLPDEPVREFSRALRKLRRTLGPLRDVDVMLQHLDEVRGPAARGAGAGWVTGRLHERRTELRRDAARTLTPRKALARLEAWVDLEHEVRDAQSTAGPLLARVAPAQVRAFAARADRVAAGPDAGPVDHANPPDASPDDVHELRVAGKLLRYTLELAEPLGHEVPRSVAKEFKALQDALGLWHDYVVLTQEMLRMAIDGQLASRHPGLFGAVQELSRMCWKRSERHLEQFRKLWNERGAALSERVAAAFAAPCAAPAEGVNREGAAPGGGANGEEVGDSQPTHDVTN